MSVVTSQMSTAPIASVAPVSTATPQTTSAHSAILPATTTSSDPQLQVSAQQSEITPRNILPKPAFNLGTLPFMTLSPLPIPRTTSAEIVPSKKRRRTRKPTAAKLKDSDLLAEAAAPLFNPSGTASTTVPNPNSVDSMVTTTAQTVSHSDSISPPTVSTAKVHYSERTVMATAEKTVASESSTKRLSEPPTLSTEHVTGTNVCTVNTG